MHSRKPTSCPEKANHVCSFKDCPCQEQQSSQLKYRTFGEEMIKGRFHGAYNGFSITIKLANANTGSPIRIYSGVFSPKEWKERFRFLKVTQ
jgi:hypothetical protein